VIEIIDIHCHLTFEQYDDDREQVIEDAKKVLRCVVTSGVEPEDAIRALELADRHKAFVFVTLGFHPIHVVEKSDEEIERYQAFIKENRARIVGIGEIGLDYYWVKEPQKIEITKKIFVQMLGLSKELDLPVVLHLRGTGAVEDGLRIVLEEDIKKAVFHCFSAKAQLAERICAEGYYISLPTSIVRSKSMKKVAKRVPLSLLFTETDAPYLSPEKDGKNVNVPQQVKVVYEEIAKQKRIDRRIVEIEIEKNFAKVFGVKLT
jgi:TatD DNase family protein